MVPPPPSQAGRFKPRKPAKKINAPGGASEPTTTDGVTNASDNRNQVPGTTNNTGGSSSNNRGFGRTGGGGDGGGGRGRDGRGGGGRDGRGGGGRGRDGRGGGGRDGRGRGRFQIPQGQAFFTATPATGNSSSIGGTLGNTRKSSQQQRGNESTVLDPRFDPMKQNGLDTTNAVQEEIVGTLEVGIGSNAVASSILSSSGSQFKKDAALNAFERALMGEEHMGGMGPISSNVLDLYDTDSSEDNDKSSRGQRPDLYKKPLCLPIPIPTLPDGVGSEQQHHQIPLTTSSGIHQQNENNRDHDAGNVQSTSTNTCPSPFVHPDDKNGIKFEKRNLFLVQLPTRLPPLRVASTDDDDNNNQNDNNNNNNDGHGNVQDQYAAVATPSVRVGSFDNTLSTAVPGKLGKIRVYKSGRTVLILEGGNGPNSSEEIEMNVAEGIHCGFQQLAVSIDMDKGEYVPLGNVEKTIVVSPNLNFVPMNS